MKSNQAINDSANWISLTAAAKISETSISTVRRWCDSDVVESKRNGNVRSVSKNSLLYYLSMKSQQNGNDNPNKTESVLATSQQHLNDKKFEEHLISSLEAERRISAELREQNKYLQNELMKITKEMHAFINNETGMFNFGKLKDAFFSKKK